MGEQLNNGRFVRSGPCLHGSDKLCDFKSFLQGNHRNSLAQTDSLEFHSTSYQAPLVFNPPAKSCKNISRTATKTSPCPLRRWESDGLTDRIPSSRAGCPWSSAANAGEWGSKPPQSAVARYFDDDLGVIHWSFHGLRTGKTPFWIEIYHHKSCINEPCWSVLHSYWMTRGWNGSGQHFAEIDWSPLPQ